jgi:hypothetical protein
MTTTESRVLALLLQNQIRLAALIIGARDVPGDNTFKNLKEESYNMIRYLESLERL